MFARTIQRHLQQGGISARRPLFHLPLTGNYRRLRRQWCDERRTWTAEWNDIVLTDTKNRRFFSLQNEEIISNPGTIKSLLL
ncbi:transposable element Tcb1 transposase [Trichonephila clavipes]|nr:transposable element Tcb1 transposase [Trichonephila clavipes]